MYRRVLWTGDILISKKYVEMPARCLQASVKHVVDDDAAGGVCLGVSTLLTLQVLSNTVFSAPRVYVSFRRCAGFTDQITNQPSRNTSKQPTDVLVIFIGSHNTNQKGPSIRIILADPSTVEMIDN